MSGGYPNTPEGKEAQRIYNAAYRKTARGKAAIKRGKKRYYDSPNGREIHRKSSLKYKASEKGKRTSFALYRARGEYLRRYKAERGCCVCGEKDSACLDLHHRDRASKNPKLISRRVRSWRILRMEELQIELTKVDVLCANCHRKAHRDEWERANRDEQEAALVS